MKIWQPSSAYGSTWEKTVAALGVSLLCDFFFPLMLLAAEPIGGGTGGTAPLLTDNQETLSLTTAFFKTIGSLVIVVGLMLLLLFWVRKMGLAKGGCSQEGLITVLDSQILAPKKQVSILEVAGTYLVVGLTEQQITLLATLDANDRLREAAQSRKTLPPLPASFASMLNKATQGISKLKHKKESAHAE